MSLYIGIAVIVVAILVVIGIVMAVVGSRRRRSQQLRQRFGPEYDRTVQSTGDTGAAERELHGREERRRGFQIHPLGAVERQRYANEWMAVQERFVDAPSQALGEADRLVNAVMAERGYPMQDFDRMADDVSVDHPHEVNDFRAAHSVALAGDRASTEDMRVGMQRYRSLFDSLLRDDGAAAGNAAARNAPAGNAPAGNAPAGNAPGGYAPGGNAPAGNAPGGYAAGSGAPAGNAPGAYAAGGNAPASNAPGDNAAGGNAPGTPTGTPRGDDR